MRTLGIIALMLVLLIGGSVVWWNVHYPTYSFRYRLALVVEADGKLHTGSSIIEIVWGGGPEIGGVGRYHPSVRGQAPLVDLGPRGAVIATLTNGDYGRAPDGTYGAIWIAARAFGNQSTNDELPQLQKLSGRRQLSPDNMPQLIWFSNISNPQTARKITAAEIPGLLGPGARLADAITNDPVAYDIDKRIPWFKPWADQYRQRGPIRLPNGTVLSRYMFLGDAS